MDMKLAELIGLPVDNAIGKHLLTLVEDSSVGPVNNILFLVAGQRKNEYPV